MKLLATEKPEQNVAAIDPWTAVHVAMGLASGLTRSSWRPRSPSPFPTPSWTWWPSAWGTGWGGAGTGRDGGSGASTPGRTAARACLCCSGPPVLLPAPSASAVSERDCRSGRSRGNAPPRRHSHTRIHASHPAMDRFWSSRWGGSGRPSGRGREDPLRPSPPLPSAEPARRVLPGPCRPSSGHQKGRKTRSYIEGARMKT